jgi:hypothetical protein
MDELVATPYFPSAQKGEPSVTIKVKCRQLENKVCTKSSPAGDLLVPSERQIRHILFVAN